HDKVLRWCSWVIERISIASGLRLAKHRRALPYQIASLFSGAASQRTSASAHAAGSSTRQSKTDSTTDRATDSMTKVGHACTDWSKTRQGADNPTTAGERVGAALERAHPARSGFCGIERSNLFWDETTR